MWANSITGKIFGPQKPVWLVSSPEGSAPQGPPSSGHPILVTHQLIANIYFRSFERHSTGFTTQELELILQEEEYWSYTGLTRLENYQNSLVIVSDHTDQHVYASRVPIVGLNAVFIVF